MQTPAFWAEARGENVLRVPGATGDPCDGSQGRKERQTASQPWMRKMGPKELWGFPCK